MKTRLTFVPLIIVALMLLGIAGCSPGGHFLTDKTYRKEVKQDFEARRALAVHRDDILFGVMGSKVVTKKEREALQFLFAYMPWADLAEYDGAFFLDNVRHSFMVQDAMPWGKTIPEDIFRHYVLPVRVNNESLDSARWVFYRELEARVKGLSLENAALEVNRWCHEKVTYKSTDGRTSSPLNTVKNAFGRCGEESVLTVAALRSVGIPARQVYVPRWAHSDDNHAWVEVWIDGTWNYMGACEPEPALNRGWFTGPAKRAMLVHTRVFGKYRGDEEVVSRENDYAVINSTAIYAEVTRPTVKVVDDKGNPVEHAKVEFGLYNYAEFYPIATLITDDNGECSLTIGRGDILLHATDGTRCTWSKHNLRTDTLITLTLNTCNLPTQPDIWHFDIPDEMPVDTDSIPGHVMEQHKKLLAQEDSIRNAYTATFPTREQLVSLAQKINVPVDSVVKYVQTSHGNHAAIMEFIEENPAFYHYLVHLSEKDLRDTDLDRLQKVFTESPPTFINEVLDQQGQVYRFESSWLINDPFKDKLMVLRQTIGNEMYQRFVLNPKIDLEYLKPYRELFREHFGPMVGVHGDASLLFDWVRDSIRVDTTPYYSRILMTPSGVHNLRVTDPYSRNIYFVAVCRSMGIPARLEPATKIPQVWVKDQWKDFNFSPITSDPDTDMGLLIIRKPAADNDPAYYNRFTISRLEPGTFKTLEFPWGQPLSGFTFPLQLKPGLYALTSGLRQSTGDIDVVRHYFRITAIDTVAIQFPVPEPQKTIAGIWPNKITEEMSNGFVFLMLEATGEPSRHLLQELQNAYASHLNRMPAVFIQWNEQDYGKINDLLGRYGLTGKVKVLRYDQTLIDSLQKMLPAAANKTPLAAGVNHKQEVCFIAGGYQINSIPRIIELLKNK